MKLFAALMSLSRRWAKCGWQYSSPQRWRTAIWTGEENHPENFPRVFDRAEEQKDDRESEGVTEIQRESSELSARRGLREVERTSENGLGGFTIDDRVHARWTVCTFDPKRYCARFPLPCAVPVPASDAVGPPAKNDFHPPPLLKPRTFRQ